MAMVCLFTLIGSYPGYRLQYYLVAKFGRPAITPAFMSGIMIFCSIVSPIVSLVNFYNRRQHGVSVLVWGDYCPWSSKSDLFNIQKIPLEVVFTRSPLNFTHRNLIRHPSTRLSLPIHQVVLSTMTLVEAKQYLRLGWLSNGDHLCHLSEGIFVNFTCW